MKGFIRHLDNYSKSHFTERDYTSLLHDINTNYIHCKVGPPVKYTTILPKKSIETPKITKTIQVSIQSLYDLIELIDNNPIDSQYQYNIDLQTLHNIRPELYAIHSMVGLESLKQSIVDQLLYFIQNLHKGVESDFKHTILLGPPGTGKTEVAKLMGKMYSKIGVLNNSVFKKVTRGDLVAGYLGQTAIKTQKVIESCLGGVLFLDEAYSLGDPTDMFAKECVDTLCEALSDQKENLMVIIAGYEEVMKYGFFAMNQGLESRFLWRFSMDPYTPAELKQIFMKKVEENMWAFENPEDISIPWFEKRKDKFKQFGRDMESLFTYTKIAHGRRIYGKSAENRKKITIEDLEKGFQIFLKHKDKKKIESVLFTMYN